MAHGVDLACVPSLTLTRVFVVSRCALFMHTIYRSSARRRAAYSSRRTAARGRSGRGGPGGRS